MPDAAGSSTPAPSSDLTGRTLGDFQLLRKLGHGGMGQVYLARQLSLKRDVAVKLLRNDLATDPTALRRFQAEAEAVARLSHAHIVQVYAVGEQDGLRYMALEYVDGRNLREYLDRKGPPDLLVTLSILRQVCSALRRAHEQGIVHRDIKPENILVTRKVEVKVTDFGLSRYFIHPDEVRLTQSGATVGTPLYIAPEQAQGDAVDHRSDIYSLGVTVYHLLTGEPPFQGRTGVEVALKHVTEQPRPLADLRPDLPAALCALVHKMLAKSPADRYQSAKDVSRDLAKIREVLSTGTAEVVSLGTADYPAAPQMVPVAVVAAGPPGRGIPAPRRWRWVAGGAACLLTGALGVFAYGMMTPPPGATSPPIVDADPDAPPERPTAERERELLDVLKAPATPDDAIAARIGLGLLRVRERRFPEADAQFAELSKPNQGAGRIPAAVAALAGRLGHAVVLANQDRGEESTRAFRAVLEAAPAGVGAGSPEQAVRAVLVQVPELGRAVADALNRNAVNLGTEKLDPDLEPFRSPKWVLGLP